MRSQLHRFLAAPAIAAVVMLVADTSANAAVIQITQARALSGGVTPGDTPGFPVTVSLAGSYILMTNLDLPKDEGTIGIEITAQGVTLDLNGFTISGPRVCDDEINPYCPPHIEDPKYRAILGGRNVTVKNGTVRGTPGNGIILGAHARLERVNVMWNSFFGVSVGRGSIVTDSLFAQNWEGAAVGGESRVTGCLFRENVLVGLDFGIGANSGYADNVFVGYSPLVIGGIQFGSNLCNGSLCP